MFCLLKDTKTKSTCHGVWGVYFIATELKKNLVMLIFELNGKSETEFEDILLCKEEMDTYNTYKDANCATKIKVLTRSRKRIKGDCQIRYVK